MVPEDRELTATWGHDAHVPVWVETEDDSLEQLVAHDQATTSSSVEDLPKDNLPSNFPLYNTEWDTYPTPFTSPASGRGLNIRSQSELVENGSNLSIEVDRNDIPHIPRQGGVPTINTDVAGSMALLLGSWQDEDGRDPQRVGPVQSILEEIEERPLSIDRRRKRASGKFDKTQLQDIELTEFVRSNRQLSKSFSYGGPGARTAEQSSL